MPFTAGLRLLRWQSQSQGNFDGILPRPIVQLICNGLIWDADSMIRAEDCLLNAMWIPAPATRKLAHAGWR